MDKLFTFTIVITVVLVLPQKCYSSGFESISETISDPSKTSNPIHNENHSTPPPEIPDLQHYMAALNQQSVLTALANLPVTTKRNMIKVLGELISICGSGHPVSMIISHIKWLLENSQEAQHSFDRKEEDESEMEDNELQVRGYGFDFGPPVPEENEAVAEKPEQKIPIPTLTKSFSKNNKLMRINTVRDSTNKKSSDMQVNTMSVFH